MKVTVCFGAIRVVVPCGEGELQVRDLIVKAVPRYRKATGKPSNSLVRVHNLRQLDGGILDPDDRLLDVADDREQIIAIYEEDTHPQKGDGTSASDESENSSPDIFKNSGHKLEPFSGNGIDVTGDELNGNPPPLHVRRGSEPALNRISPIPPYPAIPLDSTKRWSAAPVIEDESPASSTPMKEKTDSPFDGYPGERGEGSGEEKLPTSPSASSSGSSHHSATTTALSRFSRDSNRCSVQILSDNPNMVNWADAADRALDLRERKEPVGRASSTPPLSMDPSLGDCWKPLSCSELEFLVCLANDGSPLGIHVIPSIDRNGFEEGLLVEGIESDGRVARDGHIQIHDIIIEINNKTLRKVSFHKAQEIFKDAMKDPELQLLVLKKVHQTSMSRSIQIPDIANGVTNLRTPSMSLSSRTQAVMLHSNTRRMGKRLAVNLKKGTSGLGFSITTRDNPAGGEAPIYIKNILPRGAAIEEGTLRIGDRLLEVNGEVISNHHQSDVAALLRQIPVGGTASLMVSRQEKIANLGGDNDQDDSPKLPRQLPPHRVTEESLMLPWKQREILTFEIPIHDSERAGLGVSVKGKTRSGPNNENVDLGIFVKNVIHGGAASRDGRLCQNDQLLNINGVSLLAKANSEAMESLRTAMHQEGPIPGMITLTVARRVDSIKADRSRSGKPRLGSDFTLGHSSRDPIMEFYLDTSDARSGSNDFPRNNPVIQRIMGNNVALRNESYYKATQDTWNHTEERVPPYSPVDVNYFGSPTVNLPSLDTVLIHGEYDAPSSFVRETSSQSLGEPNNSSDAYVSQSSLEDSGPGFSRDQFGRQSISEKRHATLDAKNTDTYQRNKKAREEREKNRQQLQQEADREGEAGADSSPKESREVPVDVSPLTGAHTIATKSQGPQSTYLSPKVERLKYLAKLTHLKSYTGKSLTLQPSAFKRPKDLKNPESRSLRVSPSRPISPETDSSPKKSSSAVRSFQKEAKKGMTRPSLGLDWSILIHWGIGRNAIGPGLGLRKSSSLESLQTMVQELTMEEEREMNSSGGVPRGRGCNESFRAAVDRSYDAPPFSVATQMEALAEEESEFGVSGFGRSQPRQSSLNYSSVETRKKGSKRQSIFKGLGSVFRFGKHRKSLNPSFNETEDRRNVASEGGEGGGGRMHARQNDRLSPHQFWKVTENSYHPPSEGTEEDLQEDSGPSKAERMSQLRAEHQRRHAQRNGTYPTDGSEDKYEDALKQVEVLGDDVANNNSNIKSLLNFLPSTILDSGKSDSPTETSHAKIKGASLYGGCIRPHRRSPSPPPVVGPHRTINEIRSGLIIHKPPLPPRDRLINNNSKASLPPPPAKPANPLDNIIGPDFTFTFCKTIPSDGYPTWKMEEVAQNIVNQTQSDLNHAMDSVSDLNANNVLIPRICGETGADEAPRSKGVPSPRTNSLPRMGLKGKTAAKWGRRPPCPAPPPPPKGPPNPLAALNSTEVLDESRLWRLDPAPPEPKSEIRHIRSRSHDVYGSEELGRPGSRSGFVDPNKFSHYVNYEQIQMHIRKKEQERLAKLASQQYQDFRDKQTRRGHPNDDIDNRNHLLNKLEETFLQESIIASRDQREYQSQRCPREMSQQQRPISNYFEYESVQAMMTQCQQKPAATTSLHRKGYHQQTSDSYRNYCQSYGSSDTTNHSSKGQRKTMPRPHQKAPPPTSSVRQGHYAASGYRPASQYGAIHQRNLNASLPVPGSKV